MIARLVWWLALGAALAGCFPHQDAVLHGDADWVAVNYVGDVADTLPLARQHCAQYERTPLLKSTKDNVANYACIRVSASP
jgi:hypothetical protein